MEQLRGGSGKLRWREKKHATPVAPQEVALDR
jgi:hypothetical protein